MQRGGEEGEVGRGVMVEEVALGAVNDSTRLEGGLGLGVEVRSFDAQRGYGGVLEGLWKKEEIPGRSFGYTAGNYQSQYSSPLWWRRTNLSQGPRKLPSTSFSVAITQAVMFQTTKLFHYRPETSLWQH